MLSGFVFIWTALALCETAHVTLPPEPTLQSAGVTFRHQDGVVFPFFGVYYQYNGVPKNHTDVRVKIDVKNLETQECIDRSSVCHCGPPSYPGAYRVVCDEGFSAQTIVDLCSGSEQLELLILCVSESIARELLTGEGLTVSSQRLTVILVNRSDGHACPLHKRVDSGEIKTSTNVSVTVKHSGTCQLDTPHEMHPDTTQGPDVNLALLSLFAIGLIGAIVGIWFLASCLKRRFKQCKGLQEQEVVTNALRRCPVKAYKPPKRDTNGEEKCAICLEEYQVKVLVRQLTCKHRFHKACIDRWLTDKRTCPLCKQDIVGDYKGKQKSQTSTVDVRQQMERTAARATPAEDVNELTNLPTDDMEIHVHTTRQLIQDRPAVQHTELSS